MKKKPLIVLPAGGSGLIAALLAATAPNLAVAATPVGEAATLAKRALANDVIRLEPVKGQSTSSHVYEQDIDKNQGLREVYRLELRRGEAALLELSSEVFDPVLKIFNAQGQEIARDDDSGGDSNARPFFAPAREGAASYFVVVTSANDLDGEFDLKVSPRKAPRGFPPRPLAGSPTKGEITADSTVRVEDQRTEMVYFFEAIRGERVQIDVRSERNLGLELRSDNGNKVGEDEDGGEGFNPSLFHDIGEPGRYTVHVLGRPEEFGVYDLSFRKMPPPQAGAAAAAKISIGQSVGGAFKLDSPVLSGNRPYSLFELRGLKGQQVAVVASGSAAFAPAVTGSRDPYPLAIDIGAVTPAGFAEVEGTSYLPSPAANGSRKAVVKFLDDGVILVRVVGRRGMAGDFLVTAEPYSAPDAAAGAKP